MQKKPELNPNPVVNTHWKKRPVLWIALLGILLLIGFSKDLYQLIAPKAQAPILPIEVQTIKAKEASMPELAETVGTLTAKEELKIKAGGSGKVQELLVESGSYVKQGTRLAHLVAAPEVIAPFSGYLTDWLVKPGEYVAAGTELVDLVNTEVLTLTYKVPESFASKLEVSQPVEVSVKAFPHEVFKGVVEFVSPVVDRKTYTILVKATVNNANQNLWPGMSAHVSQVLETHPAALVIPEACLILTMEGYDVFVISEAKVQKRSIKIGVRRGGRVHVLSGIKAGESVVMVRTNLVTEGAVAIAHDWTGDW